MPRIYFTEKELVFIASLLNLEELIGVKDPFEGWLAEKISDEWEKAKKSNRKSVV